MPARFDALPARRRIIDRRSLSAELSGLDRNAVAKRLKAALADGRSEIARRLAEKPSAGTEAAAAYAYLTDQVVRLAHDYVVDRVHPLANPTASERLLLLAVGGYGRGEMALHSDVDIAFVTPWKAIPWIETVVESILYLLWDLGLKVGQSVRTVDELIHIAQGDHTVRTALLESRYIWGDEPLFDEVQARFWKEVVAGNVRTFVKDKLDERDERHRRMGDSRYVVEPNIKEGKGGLRDLHALFWIGKFAYRLHSVPELVDAGLLSPAELRQFERAERFLWAVRCHLHIVAGRAEERLTFDYQREIAARLYYADRPGRSPVERFMRHYFLHAKTVGDLTGVFLAHLDEKFARRGRRMIELPTLRRRPSRLQGFMLDRGRLAVPSEDFLAEDPIRLLQMFALADQHELEIHPLAMRSAARHAKLIDSSVRASDQANALFLEVLTSRRDPETLLRWMNEAGVFGRFIPDFGRVVAQMQFDMYHHYTVDEHSIRAIGLLARIEKGELKADHPLATSLIGRIASRRVLYVAVLLHDIAKGRGGDHSQLGAEVAKALCPRLGLTDAETETVAWLVRWHLLMSSTAFKRDLSDPKTIEDFVHQVQSPERLRLLLILTVVDIRAVGPGVWTEWKRVLLRTLFDAAEERLRLGHKQRGRSELIVARQKDLAKMLGWRPAIARAYAKRLPDAYWLAEPLDWQVANALQVAKAEARIGEPVPSVVAENDADSNATRISVFTPDREGLFYRICAGLAGAGANIIDARVHTTRDGMALDNLLVLDSQGRAYADRRLRNRLVRSVEAALNSSNPPRLPAGERIGSRTGAFRVAPSVVIAERASSRTTVVEVNALDRIALLAALARAIHDCGHRIHSAHIATYGERAVDVFYLTRADGRKLNSDDAAELRSALLAAASEQGEAKAA